MSDCVKGPSCNQREKCLELLVIQGLRYVKTEAETGAIYTFRRTGIFDKNKYKNKTKQKQYSIRQVDVTELCKSNCTYGK